MKINLSLSNYYKQNVPFKESLPAAGKECNTEPQRTYADVFIDEGRKDPKGFFHNLYIHLVYILKGNTCTRNNENLKLFFDDDKFDLNGKNIIWESCEEDESILKARKHVLEFLDEGINEYTQLVFFDTTNSAKEVIRADYAGIVKNNNIHIFKTNRANNDVSRMLQWNFDTRKAMYGVEQS